MSPEGVTSNNNNDDDDDPAEGLGLSWPVREPQHAPQRYCMMPQQLP